MHTMNKKTVLVVSLAACLSALADGWDASLADFPRQAGEGDDAARIQRLVDANTSGTVYFPKGVYEVSKPILVTNMCSLAFDKGAVLRAVREMPFVLDVDNREMIRPLHHNKLLDYNIFVRGGTIDGDGLASCMRLTGFMHFTLADMSFLNGKKYGLRVNGGCELIANNLYFRCLKRGLAGNTAVCINGGDSHYTDCVVVDYTIGFHQIGGGANRLTRCHVWGGKIPPPRPGEPCEMLKDSICFWIQEWSCSLRDCYADTGKTGYRIETKSNAKVELTGCWFFNNWLFKLDDTTVIDHRSGRLFVNDCAFSKDSPVCTVYRCDNPDAESVWTDIRYSGFPHPERLPGGWAWQRQEAGSPDDWELVDRTDGLACRYVSPAGEFATDACRAVTLRARPEALLRQFPSVGAGKTLVFKARATDARTKNVEVALIQGDGKAWGDVVPLSPEWKETRIPLSNLPYFSKWGLPPLEAGEKPDVRLLKKVRLTFGKWLCPDSLDKSHGFEIASIRIEQ